jgi:hypothetical protein
MWLVNKCCQEFVTASRRRVNETRLSDYLRTFIRGVASSWKDAGKEDGEKKGVEDGTKGKYVVCRGDICFRCSRTPFPCPSS